MPRGQFKTISADNREYIAKKLAGSQTLSGDYVLSEYNTNDITENFSIGTFKDSDGNEKAYVCVPFEKNGVCQDLSFSKCLGNNVAFSQIRTKENETFHSGENNEVSNVGTFVRFLRANSIAPEWALCAALLKTFKGQTIHFDAIKIATTNDYNSFVIKNRVFYNINFVDDKGNTVEVSDAQAEDFRKNVAEIIKAGLPKGE